MLPTIVLRDVVQQDHNHYGEDGEIMTMSEEHDRGGDVIAEVETEDRWFPARDLDVLKFTTQTV